MTPEPPVVCVGATITFTPSGVSDSGGQERVNCSPVDILPVTPTYTWYLTLPPGYPDPQPPLDGSGTAAIVAARAPGTYTCTVIATADRDCPPGQRPIGSEEALAILVEIDPVTSGVDPLPLNPALVAPLDVLLDNGQMFTDGNLFGLTRLEPDVDLTQLPVEWVFELTSGSITPLYGLFVNNDRRKAQLHLPDPSFGNFGGGQMRFRVNGRDCASVGTLVRNTRVDLEPKDFRFRVKAHLCTDGAGTSTSRTSSEVRILMSDVTKVLSQCGIIVTLSEVVSTTVDASYMRLDSTAWFSMWNLFDTDEDESAIDVFFINAIDHDPNANCGLTTGVTGTPEMSGWLYEAGVAVADATCDGPATGQELVRTVAHEITHYLMNHGSSEGDHVSESRNLMFPYSDDAKRDLGEGQCLTVRSNNAED